MTGSKVACVTAVLICAFAITTAHADATPLCDSQLSQIRGQAAPHRICNDHHTHPNGGCEPGTWTFGGTTYHCRAPIGIRTDTCKDGGLGDCGDTTIGCYTQRWRYYTNFQCNTLNGGTTRDGSRTGPKVTCCGYSD